MTSRGKLGMGTVSNAHCAIQLLRYWLSMKNLSSCKVTHISLTYSYFPEDTLTNNNRLRIAGFQTLAIFQTLIETKRGRGLSVVVYPFSWDIAVLILVYPSNNLATASALQSKRHLTAQFFFVTLAFPIWRWLTARQNLLRSVQKWCDWSIARVS